jgi:predicted deacylase
MPGALATSDIYVGEIGLCKLFIRKMTLKQSSEPKIAVVSNLHGDETSSLFIVSGLLKELKEAKIKRGEIDFFVFSNPAAFLLRERTWKDRVDLNRVFPGKPDENLTQDIALKLSEELGKMDLVIDLHNMDARTALLGLFPCIKERGGGETERKTLEMIIKFSPDIIWKIVESKYSNALGPYLSSLGIPNFAVEMNPPEFLTPEEILRVKNGIKRVLSEWGVIDFDEKEDRERKIPIVIRRKIVSQYSGLFSPSVKPLDKVEKGQGLGEISRDLIDWSLVESPTNGILMRISPRRFVDTGDELASVGEIEGWAP